MTSKRPHAGDLSPDELCPVDQEAAIRIGNPIEIGTVYKDRCGYLDPVPVWTGGNE